MTAELQELIKRLDLVAAKLGEGTTHFWPLVVRQVYIDFLLSTILLLVIGAATWGCYCWAKTLDWDDVNPCTVTCLALGLACCLFLVFLSISFLMDLSAILNPEYAALKSLINLVK